MNTGIMFEATASEGPQGVTPLYSKTTLSGLIWPDGSGSIGRVAARDVSEDSLKLDPYSTQEIIDHIGSNDPLGALKIDAVERASSLLDIPIYFEETPPPCPQGPRGDNPKRPKIRG